MSDWLRKPQVEEKRISGLMEDQFGNHLAASVEQYLKGKVGDVVDIKIRPTATQIFVSFTCDVPMLPALLTEMNARPLPDPYVIGAVRRKIRFLIEQED